MLLPAVFLGLLLGKSVASAAVAAVKPHYHDLFIRQDVTEGTNSSLPNVTIFATGGTIASEGTTSTQTVGYQLALGVQQLIDAVPDILNISNVAGYQVSNVGSGSINETILLRLNELISEELARDTVAGVVITHGTDTLEESSFFLDLTIDNPKPVVLVGAMRPATALSADGPLNLLQAVTLATSPNARGRGAMIVLNDRIGSAYYTTKNNANSVDTFYSTEAGQLGFFINQVPYFYYEPAQPVGKVHFNISGLTDLPMVDIIFAHQDMDLLLFNSSVQNGAEGIVLAGVGAGGMSSRASDAAEAVYNQTGVPIVASHRSSDGFVPADGSRSFTIASGFYNPQKSRILLQLCLATGYDETLVEEVFAASYPPASQVTKRR